MTLEYPTTLYYDQHSWPISARLKVVRRGGTWWGIILTSMSFFTLGTDVGVLHVMGERVIPLVFR